jgi:O-antigen ligase
MVFMGLGGSKILLNRIRAGEPLLYRAEFARSSTAILRDHPLTGTGLGTFQTVYPEYALLDVGSIVNHAHNDWLEWAVEGGVVLLLVQVIIAAYLVLPCIRSIWGVGILAVYLHALLDYPMQRLGVSGWIVMAIAAVASGAWRPSSGFSYCWRGRQSRSEGVGQIETKQAVAHQ